MFYLRIIGIIFLLAGMGCGEKPSSAPKVQIDPGNSSSSRSKGGSADESSPKAQLVRVDNPAYLRWSKHKVGTTVVVSEKTTTPTYTTETTAIYKLKSITDDEVVVELKSDIVAPDGTKHSSNSQDLTYSRYVSLPSKQEKTNLSRPIGTFEEREDNVTILGQKYPAKWYKSKGHVEAGETITETWIVDSLPTGIAKSLHTVPASKKTVSSEIVRMTGE